MPTAGSAEFEATHAERCGRLPVAEIGHKSGQIGPRDDVEQFLLVGPQPTPDLAQLSIVLTLDDSDCVNRRNDRR